MLRLDGSPNVLDDPLGAVHLLGFVRDGSSSD
jgi:hypothetical protein